MSDFEALWPGRIVVVGGGRFGRLALSRLPGRIALVAEPDPGPELAGMGVPIWRSEGVRAASLMLESRTPPKYVIPTLPVHLLAEWLRKTLANLQPKRLEAPKDLQIKLQSNIQCINNIVYASLADFLCPDDCHEPADICRVTGKPRGLPFFERMAALGAMGYKVGVVRSRQLAPGVGGLLVRDLLALKERIKRSPGAWLLATACRCHGVLEINRFGPGE